MDADSPNLAFTTIEQLSPLIEQGSVGPVDLIERSLDQVSLTGPRSRVHPL
jgi:hypothetical protein